MNIEATKDQTRNHSTSKKLQAKPNAHILQAGIGGIAGLFMEGVLHPIDTVRTRIKINTTQSVPLIAQIKSMQRSEGTLSYFRGFSCTLIGSFATNASYFFIYEKLKYILNQRSMFTEDMVPFIAAFAGGAASNFVSLPFDVVRTRMQLKPGSYDYKNFFDGAYKVLRREGFNKLYLGGSAFFALTAVETSLTFGFYEFFYKTLEPCVPSSSGINIPLSIISSVSAAAVAGSFANPLEVLVTRMQCVDTRVQGKCRLAVLVRTMYRNEGIQGFMKGVTGTISYYSAGAMLLFPTYEILKSVFRVDLSK